RPCAARRSRCRARRAAGTGHPWRPATWILSLWSKAIRTRFSSDVELPAPLRKKPALEYTLAGRNMERDVRRAVRARTVRRSSHRGQSQQREKDSLRRAVKRERATGVEPATSSLESFLGPGGIRVFR